MRKFVGYVNGKSYTNEEDFNKAAQEAIKKNDDNLSITSYYKYTSDKKENNEDEKKELPNYVSINECFLGERKPDQVSKLNPEEVGNSGYTNVVYEVSPELEAKLKTAVNKDNLKESIEYHINKLVNNIQKYRSDLKNTEDKIEALQNKLSDQQGLLLDQEGRRKYYNNLIDILEKSISAEKSEDEQKIESKDEQKVETPVITPKVKEDIRKLLNIDENTSLFDILRQVGIMK